MLLSGSKIRTWNNGVVSGSRNRRNTALFASGFIKCGKRPSNFGIQKQSWVFVSGWDGWAWVVWCSTVVFIFMVNQSTIKVLVVLGFLIFVAHTNYDYKSSQEKQLSFSNKSYKPLIWNISQLSSKCSQSIVKMPIYSWYGYCKFCFYRRLINYIYMND